MRMTCPACNAEMSLELLLGREADARAVAAFLERHLQMGELLLRYIALFRPPKRRLGLARMVALLNELLPDIERGAVNRKGRDWHAPRDVWRSAIETVIAKRDKGTLALPLASHGLLYEVISAMADKYEARTEAEAEAERKARRGSGTPAGPRDLARIASDAAASPATPIPPAVYEGPSRAARELKARMQAAMRSRGDSATSSGPADAPEPPAQAGA